MQRQAQVEGLVEVGKIFHLDRVHDRVLPAQKSEKQADESRTEKLHQRAADIALPVNEVFTHERLPLARLLTHIRATLFN